MTLRKPMPIGLYEKALPADLPWEVRLETAAKAGYDYVEISIDESESRLARLDWTPSEQMAFQTAMAKTGVPVMTMCLSAHRKYPLGSVDPQIREHGLVILRKAIEFAARFGLRIIQVNGYDEFYGPSNERTQERFISGLRKGIEWAGREGIMLGLENVDTPFVDSMGKASRVVKRLASPWFNLYPDMGNLLAAGYDPASELKLVKSHLVALHVKDAKPGIVRGVPFEQGSVPFKKVFRELNEIGFSGPLTVEMWAHLAKDDSPLLSIRTARSFVKRMIDEGMDISRQRRLKKS